MNIILAIKKRISLLFLITVMIPTLFSTIYFGLFASDIYTSTSSFIVRSPASNNSLSGFGALIQSVGFSRSQDDTYTLKEYLYSRESLSKLQQKLPVKDFYSEKGDFLSRHNFLGLNNSEESFYQYFRKKIVLNLDSASGIATFSVKAFDSQDAQLINKELLKQGELLINQLNTRARKDSLKFAIKNVEDAETRVKDTAQALTDYRVKHNIFDISTEATEQFSFVKTLEKKLIGIQNKIDQLKKISPQNSQIALLKQREKSIQDELKKQSANLFDAQNSFATQTTEYQRLMLDNKLAENILTAALTSLQHTQNELSKQQLYLEVISSPSKPDMALEPHRLYNIIAIFFICFMIFGVLKLMIASIKEHKN